MTWLNTLRVGEQTFIHSIDMENDSTYLKDEDDNVIYEVTFNGKMTNGRDVELGTFHLDEKGKWFFSPDGGYHGKLKMTIKSNDLIETERFIFEFMLKVKTCHEHRG